MKSEEELRAAAAEIDSAKLFPDIPAAETEKKKRGRKKGSVGAAKQVDVDEPDPSIVALVNGGVDALVKIVREKREWSDPGKQWTANVSLLTAKIISKYLPETKFGDEIILAGLIIAWVGPNLISERGGKTANVGAKNTGIRGDDGKRENLPGGGNSQDVAAPDNPKPNRGRRAEA